MCVFSTISRMMRAKKKAVLNKKETAIAQSKQELIKQGFQDWVWRDPARREKLVRLYNDKFNSIRPREYDGSHIIFSGMNPEIKLGTSEKMRLPIFFTAAIRSGARSRRRQNL